MAYEFKVTRRVEFSETDMAGIVHFANFFRYMEFAEHAFFRSLGRSIVMGDVGFPRVHAHCDYHKPLRFEDVIEIHLLVAEKRSKVLTYIFKFGKQTAEGLIEVARGKLTVVCVAHKADGSMTSTHIPAELAAQIETAPPELLK